MDADAISRLDYGGRVPRDIGRDAGVTSQGSDRKLSFNNDRGFAALRAELHDICGLIVRELAPTLRTLQKDH